MFGGYYGGRRDDSINDRGIERKAGEKRVVSTAMVAHVWVQRTQHEARNGKGTFWFRGNTLYSYEQPIAMMHETPQGTVVLETSETFSVTTSSHSSKLWRALDGRDYIERFRVPVIDPDCVEHHQTNMEHLWSDIRSYAARCAKPHVEIWDAGSSADERRSSIRREWLEQSNVVEDYAAAFEVDPVSFDIDAAQREIDEAFARYNDPKRVANREKAKAKRELKHFKALQLYHAWREGVCERPDADLFPAHSEARRVVDRAIWDERSANASWKAPRITADEWLAGKRGAFYQDSPTLVRRVGGKLETSRQADVPWHHAVIAYMQAIRCRATGMTYRPNGLTLKVGAFTVDEITPKGNLRAGCHLLGFDEMTRLAVQEVPELVKAPYPLPVCISVN